MGNSQELPLQWSFGIRATTPDEIRLAAELGFDFVDLDFNHRPNIEQYKDDLGELGARYGLFFTAHGAGSMFDRGNGFEETLRDIDTAGPFQPLSFTIHPIYNRRMFTPEQLKEKVRKVSVLITSAARYGFPIAIENIIEQPDDFTDLLAELPELGVALDTGHAELVLQSQRNKSFGFIERWFPRIIHIHVHDNVGGNTVRDDLHLEVGLGTIDYGSIVRELVHRRYRGTFLFEMEAIAASRSRKLILNLLQLAWEG